MTLRDPERHRFLVVRGDEVLVYYECGHHEKANSVSAHEYEVPALCPECYPGGHDSFAVPQEPALHSALSDRLPSNHPLANQDVSCAECGRLVHASNNECMSTWVEFSNHNVCIECFENKERVVL